MRTQPPGDVGVVILTLSVVGVLVAVFLGAAVGPVTALAFAAGMGAAIAVWAWKARRRADPERRPERAPCAIAPDDGISRLLVVADPGCRAEALADEVQRVAAGRPAEVYVVGPARHAPEGRLDEMLAFLAAAGVKARASLGDDDPLRATDDVLACFSAGEIVYVTSPGSTWLDGEIVALAERRYDQRVRSIVVEP